MAVLLVLAAANSAVADITIPPGYGTVISAAQDGGCNVVEYGYLLSSASAPVHVDTHLPGDCSSQPLAGAVIPSVGSTRSLLVYIQDDSCGPATYWSDGTGTANHALVVGSDPYGVYLDDAGGSCSRTNVATIPTTTAYNFKANVAITPPPAVTVSAPNPPSGQAGYFDRKDVSAAGGSIRVTVSASDNSATGVASLGCTDNGSSTAVTAASGAGTPTMNGTVNVSANGSHRIVCTANDNAGGSGNTGSANTSTVNIDTTAPALSVSANPLLVAAIGSSEAVVSSYPVGVSDPDPGDSPRTSCTPQAPAVFPIGSTTVTCQATDRAGNSTSVQFVVDVVAPSASIGSIRTFGPAASVTIACAGVGSQRCEGTLTATAREISRRGAIVGVMARGKHGSSKITRVVVARASFSLAAGMLETLHVMLRPSATQLFDRFGRLPVTWAISGAPGTGRVTVFTPGRIRVGTPPDNWFHINPPCSSDCYTSAQNVPITGVPTAAHVTVICRGAGCPFSRRSVTPHKGSINLASVLAGSHLQPGTRVTAAIRGPGGTGETLVYTMRRGSGPLRTISAGAG
jgi:hypothetical protein